MGSEDAQMKIINIHPLSRREFGRLAGLGSLGLGLFEAFAKAQDWSESGGFPELPDNISRLEQDQPLVYAIWRYVGSIYYFDPIGLHVQPGETVGFVVGGASSRNPAIASYHPDNDNHELRIPENAQSFDSGELSRTRRAPSFNWTFEVEGTYDYYSKYTEWRGMVGRIVVGKPGGPGENPWGYGNKEGRRPIPPEVLKRTHLMNSQEIVRKKAIAFPFEQFTVPYPQC